MVDVVRKQCCRDQKLSFLSICLVRYTSEEVKLTWRLFFELFL